MRTDSLSPRPAPLPRGVLRWTVWLLAAALAVLMLLKLSGTLHYITDYSEASYTRWWPRRPWIQLHLVAGLVATVAGPFQFWSGLRRGALRVHRGLGFAYLGAIALGGVAGLQLALAAPGGWARQSALVAMAAAWWVTTGMAYFAVARRAIQQHREWMTRSYAVTLGGFGGSRLLEDLSVLLDPTMLQDLPRALSVDAGLLWLSFTAPLLLVEVVLQGRKIVARGTGA